MKAKWLIPAAVLMLAVQPAQAQAIFGIRQGQAVGTLKVVRSYEDDRYAISPPTPNPEFESYMVTAPAGIGVCRITGLGVSYRGADADHRVTAAFDRTRTMLDAKYGASTMISYRTDRTTSWAVQLRSEDAAHSAYWPKDLSDTVHGLTPDLDSIGLSVVALEDGTLYLSLRYEFRNFSRCEASEARSQSQGL